LEIQAIMDHRIEGVNFTITITHLPIETQNNTNLHLMWYKVVDLIRDQVQEVQLDRDQDKGMPHRLEQL
jgi:hypothetical protein